MSYATKQDMIDRFGERERVQLTDGTNVPVTTIDDTVVARHLADADGTVDGYVGKVYSLPLPAVPDMLRKIAADLARYYLHGKAAETDGAVHRAYRDAIAWLKDVSKGLVKLDLGGDDAGSEVPQAGGGAVHAKAPDRVFTRDSMRDY